MSTFENDTLACMNSVLAYMKDHPNAGDTIGCKEMTEPSLLTKEQLIHNIEKIHQLEYRLHPLDILFENQLKINMKEPALMNTIIKSFYVKFVPTCDSIPSDSIQQMTKNFKYSVNSGNQILWADQFTNEQNVIVSDILLPIKIITHQDVVLHIDITEECKPFLDKMDILIQFEHVDLYSHMDNNLVDTPVVKNSKVHYIGIEQTIHLHNTCSVFRIMCGLCGVY